MIIADVVTRPFDERVLQNRLWSIAAQRASGGLPAQKHSRCFDARRCERRLLRREQITKARARIVSAVT